jgi:hypothetical protein
LGETLKTDEAVLKQNQQKSVLTKVLKQKSPQRQCI